MRRLTIFGCLAVSILALVLSFGCSSDSSDDSGNEAVDAVTSATPGVPEAQLGESHAGWKNAGCLTCHQNVHANGEATPQCVACHGVNGAPQREAGHASGNCIQCHTESHAELSFDSDDTCVACHKYDDSEVCPVTENAEVVVIGAGGGGLSAATILARAGKKVVLIEKHNRVGGYMSQFRRGDYSFEISLHAMGGLDHEEGETPKDFGKLGIWDKLKPVRLDPMYKVVTQDLEMTIPSDPEQFKAQLKELVPEEADGIDLLFEDIYELEAKYQELAAAQGAGGETWAEYAASHAGDMMELFNYMSITLSDMLDDYITDPRLKMLMSQLASYAGTEPDTISAAFYMVMWFGYHLHGFYNFEGGSKSISEAMADEIRENGGIVKLNTLVEKIVIEDGKAVEVQTQNDACYRADYVISNANAPATMLEMVGAEYLPEEYVTDIENMTIGLSGIVLYIGVDADLTQYFDGAHEIFVNDSFDQHLNFSYNDECNADAAPFLVTNYSLSDPTAAPEGKNVIVIASELGYDWNDVWKFYEDRDMYQSIKKEIADKLLYRTEQLLPGMTEHIETISIATPPTLERFTLNPKGTFFGFDGIPEQSLLNRLPQETPIDNLFLAGAWTFPGPGQSAVITSGITAANLVLKAMEGGDNSDGDADEIEDELEEAE